jgi:nicotinamidase-related amidase
LDTFQNPGTALILIDIQKGFSNIDYWGGDRNNPDAEVNAQKLLNTWRKFHLPLFHVQHCSSNPSSILAPGSPGNMFKEEVTPLAGEPIIQKNVNSAFIGTELKKLLDEQKIHTLVILGLTTEHCVSTTARMSGNYGYHTFVVSDATAAFNKTGINNEKYNAETIHLTALAMIKDEFATIVTTNEILEHFA